MTQPCFRFSSGLLAKQCIYCTLSQKPGSMHFLVFVRKPAIGRRKIQTAFERGIFSQNATLKSRNYPRRIPSAKERSNGRTQLEKSCSARGRKTSVINRHYHVRKCGEAKLVSMAEDYHNDRCPSILCLRFPIYPVVLWIRYIVWWFFERVQRHGLS